MSEKIPHCFCINRQAGHNPECPVRMKIEALEDKVRDLTESLLISHSVMTKEQYAKCRERKHKMTAQAEGG